MKKAFASLQINKSTGSGNISARLLTPAAPVIAAPITAIMNNSIRTGRFPSSWKLAKVSPVHKKGPISDKGNYRPVSVLCALSKILERHVHDGLYNYLVSHNMLYGGQSEFRAQHSCETALSYMVHKWALAIDRGLLNGIVLLDLRKAFDLVNHEILLEKLEIYGCSAGSMTWFASYLTGRKQMVSFRGHLSDIETVTVCVPQGSILGPLFFIIFMNDMPLNTGSHDPVDMYADDSTVSASGNTLEHRQASLKNDLENVLQSCDVNRMVMNTDKTIR